MPKRTTNTGIERLTYYVKEKQYAWYDPETQLMVRLGPDKEQAIIDARVMNFDYETKKKSDDQVSQRARNYIENGSPRTPRLDFLFDRYIKTEVPNKKWSEQRLIDNLRTLRKIRKHIGNHTTVTIRTVHIADYLDTLKQWAKPNHKSLLNSFFIWCISKGLMEQNPVVNTISREPEKVRGRLRLDEFQKILAAAPSYLQIAMLIGLRTFLRPIDIVNLRFDAVVDGFLYTGLSKTKNYSKPVYLKIEIDQPLQKIIERARDDIESPYIVHKPLYQKTMNIERTFVTRKYLSKEFTKVRDELGVQADLPREARATLYEVRALGSWLSKEYADMKAIQNLMGHTDERMTQHYQEGHEIEYTQVKPLLPDSLEDIKTNDGGPTPEWIDRMKPSRTRS